MEPTAPLDVGRRHWLPAVGEAHHDAAQAFPQVLQAAAEGQDRHHL